MANYRTHTYFNFFLGLPLLLGAMLYFVHPPMQFVIIFVLAFSYGTLFMSPDLDIAFNFKFFSLRGFFAIPFRLYSRIFKHRGLSHSYFFGSVTRIVWISLFGLCAFYLIYQTLPSESDFVMFYSKYKWHLAYGFAGICCADWCHLFLDKL